MESKKTQSPKKGELLTVEDWWGKVEGELSD